MLHRYLVYDLPRDGARRHGPTAEASCASEELVCRLFCDDARRRGLFLTYLKRGMWGVLIHEGDTWQTYAWMSRPTTPGPRHLPAWAGRLGAYWIYFCRTQEAHRGKGLYRAAMDHLIARARAADPDATVLIDTTPPNTASRRAILRTGFAALGVVYVLDVPGIRRQGIWLKGRAHPGGDAVV